MRVLRLVAFSSQAPVLVDRLWRQEPEAEQTVRDLAATLNISKPAITRALDRLETLVFTRRETDKNDRRSVIARRTTNGSAYLRTLGGYITEASKQVKK